LKGDEISKIKFSFLSVNRKKRSSDKEINSARYPKNNKLWQHQLIWSKQSGKIYPIYCLLEIAMTQIFIGQFIEFSNVKFINMSFMAAHVIKCSSGQRFESISI